MKKGDAPGSVNISQQGEQNAAQTGSGNQRLSKTSVSRAPQNRSKYFTVGSCLTVVAVGFAVWGFALGTLTPDQRQILLWILPIASGFACGAFAGAITAKAQGILPGLLVTATGGFAVWLITILVLFPKQSVGPTAPSTAGSEAVSPSGSGSPNP